MIPLIGPRAQASQSLLRKAMPAPSRCEVSPADTCPDTRPGKAISCASWALVVVLKNGRASTGVPLEDAKKSVEAFSRPKKCASTPMVRAGSNQYPARTRPPERQSWLTVDWPNSTEVPGAPSTPAVASRVEGPVVTKAGNLSPLVCQ